MQDELELKVRQRTSALQRANDALTAEVADRRRAEERLRRLERAWRALSSGNRALVRAADEDSFLRELCRVVVEVAGYRLCWVGFAEHDAARTVRPVAHAGYERGLPPQRQRLLGRHRARPRPGRPRHPIRDAR